MADLTVRALAETVSSLDAAAQAHKRWEAYHRKRARATREMMRRIRESCNDLGIELVIEHRDSEGSHSDGRSSRT